MGDLGGFVLRGGFHVRVGFGGLETSGDASGMSVGRWRKVNKTAACEVNEAAVSKTETSKIFGKPWTLGGGGFFSSWPNGQFSFRPPPSEFAVFSMFNLKTDF